MSLLLKNKWEIRQIKENGSPESLLDSVLHSRGIITPDDKAEFLSPAFYVVHDPFLFRDMAAACDVITAAIRLKQKIIIYGDYDVDGITSTSLLSLFLKRMGANVDFVIPDRILEGYGLTEFGVNKLIDLEAELVITVDCGISSVQEVQSLMDRNITVVVTDHHECRSELPHAAAVLNPKRQDSRYPFRHLAGVGVVLKLVQALCIRLETGDIWKNYIDLAALGTVADVVSLTGENRMIVYWGLVEMNRSRNNGIKSLLNAIDQSEKEITSTTIGFRIAPRINAAGRMGDSRRAVRLLTDENEEVCDRLANELICDNKRRQEIEAEIFEEAKRLIKENYDFLTNEILVVHKKGWHQGVIGIVASKLSELFHRSVIVLGGEDEFYKGSARGINGISILEAIEYAGPSVYRFGGHQKAAGLIVKEEKMDSFRAAIREFSEMQQNREMEENSIDVDFEIPFQEVTLDNAQALSRLAPFGEGNQQPVFACRNVSVDQIRFLSSGKHTKMSLSDPDRTVSGNNGMLPGFVDAIAFGFHEKNLTISSGDRIDVVFYLDQNDWNGKKTVQIVVKDIRRSLNKNEEQFQQLEEGYRSSRMPLSRLITGTSLDMQELVPQKTDFVVTYQYLKTNYQTGFVLCDLDILSILISNNYKTSISTFKLARIFDIFKEVGLLDVQPIGLYRIKFQLVGVSSKVSLADSSTYKAICTESVML